MPEHSQALDRQLMQTSQDVLCLFSALFPRNMAQTGAAAILLHADVNYSGGREWWAGHICQWMMSPRALRKSMKHKSQPSVGKLHLNNNICKMLPEQKDCLIPAYFQI